MRAVILLGGPNKGTRFRPLSLVWVLTGLISATGMVRGTVDGPLFRTIKNPIKTFLSHFFLWVAYQ